MHYFQTSLLNLKRTISGFANGSDVEVSLGIPANILVYAKGITAFPLGADLATLGISETHTMEKYLDRYELKGKKEALLQIIQTLYDNASTPATYSTPISGFFLRARGINAAVMFAADSAHVQCKMYGSSYISASGPACNMADFVGLIKDMEYRANGGVSLYEWRQQRIDAATKAAEKAGHKHERHERHRKNPILRHFLRSSTGAETEIPPQPVGAHTAPSPAGVDGG